MDRLRMGTRVRTKEGNYISTSDWEGLSEAFPAGKEGVVKDSNGKAALAYLIAFDEGPEIWVSEYGIEPV